MRVQAREVDEGVGVRGILSSLSLSFVFVLFDQDQ